MKKCLMIVVLFIFVMLVSSKYDSYTITYVAKNNYLDGNLSTSGNYRVDDQKAVIYNIEMGTTVGAIKSKFDSQATITIYKNDGSAALIDSEAVQTGYTLKAMFSGDAMKDYTLAVMGDVLGEGTISTSGIQKVANHILSGKEITDDASLRAADYDGSGEIQINDVTKMLKILGGGRTLTATFVISNNSIATADGKTATCMLYDGASSCTITAPKLTPKSGYAVLGWNSNGSAHTAEISNGGTMTISSNKTFYAIGGKAVTVTFDKGRTYDTNTVSPGSAGYDYSLTNIQAESLEYYTESCINWDGSGCYLDNLPAIYSPGNEPHGYATSYNGVPVYVLETKIPYDMKLYARVYNDYVKDYFTLGESIIVGGVAFEFEKGLDAATFSYYVDYINRLYKHLPQLFIMRGKVRISTEETYLKIQDGHCGANSGGCCRSLYMTNPIDIRHYKNYTYASLITISHELGHAFDFVYAARTRKYPDGFISKKTDLLNLYNNYSAMEESSRPISDYAYKTQHEFFAEAVALYHGITFMDKEFIEYRKYINSLLKSTDELNLLLAKYFCIARNNFNESANCP